MRLILKAELIKQCGEESQKAEIEAGTWDILEVGALP